MTEAVRIEMAAMLPRLRRFAHALAGDRDEGDDLVQAACAKALSALHQFTPGTRLDAWMFTIIRTGFLDRARSRMRRPTVCDPDAAEALSDGGVGARSAEDRLMLARVRAAMAQLPEDQRAVLALVAIEGFAYREAAEMLDVPLGTVMSRLARARARLADALQEKRA
ncbi:MAG: RNA polymerase sigma factor [Rubrimonas sp.]